MMQTVAAAKPKPSTTTRLVTVKLATPLVGQHHLISLTGGAPVRVILAA